MTRQDKITGIEKLKQTSNIWAMLAAGVFIAALFQGFWILGPLFGAYSLHMSNKFIEKRVLMESEVYNG